jgi:hypothetical protein
MLRVGKHIVILLSIFHSHITYSQTAYQVTYGTTRDEEAFSIIQTSDGGYAFAGYAFTTSTVKSWYIVKTDASFEIEWTYTTYTSYPNSNCGGSNNARQIIQDTDGGYVVVGDMCNTGQGYPDIYVIKLSSTGTLVWRRQFDANGAGSNDFGKGVAQLQDGSYMIGGYGDTPANGRDFYFIKLKTDGTVDWRVRYGGNSTESAHGMIRTSSGDFVMTGSTNSSGNGSNDVYLVKINSSGSNLWFRYTGGTGSDEARAITEDANDGGYVVAGLTNSFTAGSSDVYVVKFNSSGSQLWTRRVGGTGAEQGNAIVQTTDGGFIVAGSTLSANISSGGSDIYLVKLSSTGTVDWTRAIGTTANESASSIIKNSNGEYIIAGYLMSREIEMHMSSL